MSTKKCHPHPKYTDDYKTALDDRNKCCTNDEDFAELDTWDEMEPEDLKRVLRFSNNKCALPKSICDSVTHGTEGDIIENDADLRYLLAAVEAGGHSANSVNSACVDRINQRLFSAESVIKKHYDFVEFLGYAGLIMLSERQGTGGVFNTKANEPHIHTQEMVFVIDQYLAEHSEIGKTKPDPAASLLSDMTTISCTHARGNAYLTWYLLAQQKYKIKPLLKYFIELPSGELTFANLPLLTSLFNIYVYNPKKHEFKRTTRVDMVNGALDVDNDPTIPLEIKWEMSENYLKAYAQQLGEELIVLPTSKIIQGNLVAVVGKQLNRIGDHMLPALNKIYRKMYGSGKDRTYEELHLVYPGAKKGEYVIKIQRYNRSVDLRFNHPNKQPESRSSGETTRRSGKETTKLAVNVLSSTTCNKRGMVKLTDLKKFAKLNQISLGKNKRKADICQAILDAAKVANVVVELPLELTKGMFPENAKPATTGKPTSGKPTKPVRKTGKKVFDPSRPCGSKTRAKNRYTKADLIELAKAYGINPKGKTMNKLCQELATLVKS